MKGMFIDQSILEYLQDTMTCMGIELIVFLNLYLNLSI